MKLICNVAVVVALLVILSVLPTTDAAAKCEAGDTGPKCSSCARKGTCAGVAAGGDVSLLEACPTDMACTMVSGLAVCKPTAETECDCGGRTKGCDVYNPQRINICIPNQRPILAQLCADSQVCSDAECVGPEQNACNQKNNLEFALSTPDCTSAALCYDQKVAAVEWCDPGEYFNLEREKCEVYSPNPCANCAESMCPIMSDCTKYAACANGKLVSEETCASSGTNFDFDLQKCTTDTLFNNPCSDYVGCNFDLITTSTTTPTTTTSSSTTTTSSTTTKPATTRPATCTAANAGQRYPHETDCKRYYSCREVTRSNYRYVVSTCLGETVFNPVNRYCDLLSQVPGCNP